MDSNALIAIFKAFDALCVPEADIVSENGGWTFYAVDPSHVSVVSAFIKPEAFSDYEEFEEMICVPVPFMLDVLQKDKVCDLTIENRSIVLKYDNGKRSKRLLDPENVVRRFPNLEDMSTCMVMSDDLIAVAKQKCYETIISDIPGVKFHLTEDGMTFSSTSEMESAEMTVNGTSVLVDGDQMAYYDWINIVAPVLRGLPKATVTTISMRTANPLIISLNEPAYSMDIYVAPMIMED